MFTHIILYKYTDRDNKESKRIKPEKAKISTRKIRSKKQSVENQEIVAPKKQFVSHQIMDNYELRNYLKKKE